jgi:predicted KAP-like P-loop ATPase
VRLGTAAWPLECGLETDDHGDVGMEGFGLSPDRPGSDPAEDRLGRAPFARHLAKSILRLPSDNGLVIALYGAWGSGKTTTLNYILHFLGQHSEAGRPIVLSFNPWWFSGSEDLIRAFFGQLQAVLGEKALVPGKVREKLADLADLVSEVPLPHGSWGWLPLRHLARCLRPKPKGVPKLKKEAEQALRDAGRRILVVMDDIDRLPSEEIRQIFRMVKGVADFPNVTYLMAFDRRVVSRALRKLQSAPGDDYLRKIVQVEFELPLPDRLSLANMLFESLNSVLAGAAPETFDKTYWGNMFYGGIETFLETPRDVIRLANALTAIFPAVRGEVNPVDFIAIETLRLFSPDIYDTIRRNKEMFAGGAPSHMIRPTRDELLKLHNGWSESLRERDERHADAVKDMLIRLFPGRLKAVWENTQYGPDWEEEWRRQLRICSEDVFPVYFAFAVPQGEISNSELQAVLQVAQDPASFSAALLRLVRERRPDGRTKASAFLDRLQDFTQAQIPIERIEPIVASLFDIGDELIVPDDESRGFFDFGNDVQIGRITWQLLKRLDPDQRFAVLQRAFEAGRAIYLMWHAVVVLGQQQGKYPEQKASPESEWLITSEQLSALEEALVERIRAAGHHGFLLDTPHLPLVLNFWRTKATPEEVKAWASEALRDDVGLVKVLERSLQTGASVSFGDRMARSHDRLDPKWLENYLDPNETAARMRELLDRPDSLTDRQARAIREYLKEYEMRKAGKDPNNPQSYLER